MIMEKDEVICISSDDEDESDKINSKQNSKQSKSSSYNEMNKKSDLVYKHKESQSEDEKKDIGKQKRKISEVDSTSIRKDSGMGKKAKTDLMPEENKDFVKNNGNGKNIKSQENASVSGNNRTIKPQLIIKERKSISPLEQDAFPMLIGLCLQKKREQDMEIIVNKMKRRYELMDPVYAKSEAFQNFLNAKRNAILTTDNMIYHHIMDIMTEMKSKHKESSKIALQEKATKNSVCPSISSNHVLSTSIFNNTKKTEAEEEDYEVDCREDTMHPHTKRRFKKIVKAMKICEKRIKKLEEAEVDFNDDDNSNYIKLEKYKERMVKLYNEYCRITGDNTDAGRSYLRPKHLNTTQIASVDQAITNFINAKITKRNKLKKSGRFTDDLIFPDYRDILKCVSNCNERNNLGLDKKRQSLIAKKAFVDLGEHLQRARRNDYWDTFSLFLENRLDDPALRDKKLAQKLHMNRELGEQKLAQVFQEYVKKQENMKDFLLEDKTEAKNDNDEDKDVESKDEDENSEEDDEEEDENDNIEDEEESEEDNSIDDSEESGDEKKKDTSTLSSINSTKNGTVERASNSKKNVSYVEEKRSNENTIIANAEEAQCNKARLNKSVLPKNVTERSSLEKKSDTVIAQQISTPNNNNILDDIEDEVVPLDDDSDGKADENKPLLRVRSFAKPPTTWEDNKQKSQTEENQATSEVIDLTAEVPKLKIQVAKTVLPTKGKCKALLIPANLAGKNIISVRTITNNYFERDPRANTSSNSKATQIVKSLPVVREVFVVSDKQSMNSNEKGNGTKQNQTYLRVLIPTKPPHQNKSIETPKNVSQRKAK